MQSEVSNLQAPYQVVHVVADCQDISAHAETLPQQPGHIVSQQWQSDVSQTSLPQGSLSLAIPHQMPDKL